MNIGNRYYPSSKIFTQILDKLNLSSARFRKTFKQSLLAISFISGSFIAGSLFVIFSNVFSSYPWVLILYLGILSARGVIGGLFSARLSTGLHIGTLRARFRNNTKEFRLLYYSSYVLAFQTSVIISLITSVVSILSKHTTSIEVVRIFLASISTMGFSFLIVSPVTVMIGTLVFRHGFDPDIIAYPIISTIADVMTTICFILVLHPLIFGGSLGISVIVSFDFLLLSIFLLSFFRYWGEEEFSSTIKEFIIALVVVSSIANLTGNTLLKINNLIGGKPEIYLAYPSLISAIGAVGSIVGSTATTKLALGIIKPNLEEIKENIPEIGGASGASFLIFFFFAVLSSYLANRMIIVNQLLQVIPIFLTLNILASPTISIISYLIAVLTYRYGLNPDNFVIPFESSLSDSLTTICLYTTLLILK